ncbi:MAG: T9SS type A sorting domain-containing protein [Bacteroidota bacterium]
MNTIIFHTQYRVVLQITGIVLLLVILCSQSAVSQTKFIKYDLNPVLIAGPTGSWDENVDGIYGCSVIYHNSKYHMWYGGYKGNVGAIGYAYSDDGTSWTKYSGNPVFTPGAAGDFDAGIGGCFVLFNSGKFHMYYNGTNTGTTRIGYAYSVDGIQWTKHPTYVFEKGAVGAWDEKNIAIGSVIKEDSVLKMFYTGKSTTSSWFTGFATSPDSIHWTRPDSGNPVLGGGVMGAWDQYSQNSGTVLKNGSLFEMWYDNQQQAPYCIGYAHSTDGGLNWITHKDNPIIKGDAGTWDAGFTIYPMVVKRPDGRYLLYYTGVNGEWTTQSIGLAIEDTTLTKTGNYKFENPSSFVLAQNYPNPFNPTTTIEYQVPKQSLIALKVFDLLGREIATLVNEEKETGRYSVQFSMSKYQVSSGVYFYCLQAGQHSAVRKMLLVR